MDYLCLILKFVGWSEIQKFVKCKELRVLNYIQIIDGKSVRLNEDLNRILEICVLM